MNDTIEYNKTIFSNVKLADLVIERDRLEAKLEHSIATYGWHLEDVEAKVEALDTLIELYSA